LANDNVLMEAGGFYIGGFTVYWRCGLDRVDWSCTHHMEQLCLSFDADTVCRPCVNSQSQNRTDQRTCWTTLRSPYVQLWAIRGFNQFEYCHL